MNEDPYTQAPYGPFKWAALGLACAGTVVSLVFTDHEWLGPVFGYAMIIGLLCNVPMGRLLGRHARVVQLIGGLLIIALAVVLIRSQQPVGPAQGIVIALLGAVVLVQGIFPRLRTWRIGKDPEGTRPPVAFEDKGRRRQV